MENIIVAASNLIGLCHVWLNFDTHKFMIFPILASILYHLAETKHGLSGIAPFNEFTFILLQLDRFYALISAFIVGYVIFNKYDQLPGMFWYDLVIGLIDLTLSEKDTICSNLVNRDWKLNAVLFHVSKIEFVIIHSLWHILAYNVLATALEFLN